MARKKKTAATGIAVDEEVAEAGRLMSSMERAGFKEIVDYVRAVAKSTGKSVSEVMAELIKAGMSYEKYRSLTLADLMTAMDFLERLFTNFIYPIMSLTRQMTVETELKTAEQIARRLGYIHISEAELMAQRRAEEVARAAQAAAPPQPAAEAQKGEGPITTFFKTLSEEAARRIAEKIADEIVTNEAIRGILERVMQSALSETLQEELQAPQPAAEAQEEPRAAAPAAIEVLREEEGGGGEEVDEGKD